MDKKRAKKNKRRFIQFDIENNAQQMQSLDSNQDFTDRAKRKVNNKIEKKNKDY